jgi:hypothetical protein
MSLLSECLRLLPCAQDQPTQSFRLLAESCHFALLAAAARYCEMPSHSVSRMKWFAETPDWIVKIGVAQLQVEDCQLVLQ